MVLPRGNWQKLKEYEGCQIYIDPDSGQFGAHLGNTNHSWMARKDLKVIEREIRKRRGGVPVVMVRDRRVWRMELTAYEKDNWLTSDGSKWATYNSVPYPFNAELFVTLEGLVAQREELRRQERILDQAWDEATRLHKSIRERDLPELLAACRAVQGNDEAAREDRIQHLQHKLGELRDELPRVAGIDDRIKLRMVQVQIEEAEAELRAMHGEDQE